MHPKIKKFLAIAALPIFLLLSIGLFFLLIRLLGLPGIDEMETMAEMAFAEHGYWIVFYAALAEGLLMANWYLPGSVVVVMGVVFAKQNGYSPFWMVQVITLGFLVTAVFNYALGRYGWYRLLLKFGLKETLEKTKKKVERHGLKIIFGTYFHPNTGALIATSAGILKLPFSRFFWYSLLALLAWNTLWGFVVYWGGEALLNMVNLKNLLLIILGWVVVLGVRFVWSQRKSALPELVED